jgi:hypothetical protein
VVSIFQTTDSYFWEITRPFIVWSMKSIKIDSVRLLYEFVLQPQQSTARCANMLRWSSLYNALRLIWKCIRVNSDSLDSCTFHEILYKQDDDSANEEGSLWYSTTKVVSNLRTTNRFDYITGNWLVVFLFKLFITGEDQTAGSFCRCWRCLWCDCIDCIYHFGEEIHRSSAFCFSLRFSIILYFRRF